MSSTPVYGMDRTSHLRAIERGVEHARTVLRAVDDCDPHGIPRPDEIRRRVYFVDPVTQLQVLVNVWPGGSLDAAFETSPGVFGVPVTARRSESEVVG